MSDEDPIELLGAPPPLSPAKLKQVAMKHWGPSFMKDWKALPKALKREELL